MTLSQYPLDVLIGEGCVKPAGSANESDDDELVRHPRHLVGDDAVGAVIKERIQPLFFGLGISTAG